MRKSIDWIDRITPLVVYCVPFASVGVYAIKLAGATPAVWLPLLLAIPAIIIPLLLFGVFRAWKD